MFDNNAPADQTGTTPEVKFKVGDREYDVQSAATKIQHADTHISTLESELKALRDQLALTEAQKKALEALSSQPQHSPAPAPTSAPALDKDALLAEAEQRVFDTLNKRQQEALAKQNLEAATAEAKKVYGDSYQQVLLERGAELGMDKNEIMAFAQSKPEAFKRLFNLSGTQARPQVPPSSSYRPSTTDITDPIKLAAKAAVDRNASSRQRTEAIALALKNVKF
jgi:vacuolar-type H+-ATPase subunit I/STV1